jgi:hypothetical protein
MLKKVVKHVGVPVMLQIQYRSMYLKKLHQGNLYFVIT